MKKIISMILVMGLIILMPGFSASVRADDTAPAAEETEMSQKEEKIPADEIIPTEESETVEEAEPVKSDTPDDTVIPVEEQGSAEEMTPAEVSSPGDAISVENESDDLSPWETEVSTWEELRNAMKSACDIIILTQDISCPGYNNDADYENNNVSKIMIDNAMRAFCFFTNCINRNLF